jgi:hypothetical protein
MVDFAALKRNSGKASLERLTAEVGKMNDRAGKADERFWTPTKDKAGNGYAVIRFLPPPEGEDVPFIRRFDHGFKGPTGKWYIELSRTSLGSNEKDPVGEFNSHLWALSNNDDESPYRKQAREQKRRLHFISNILVIKDSANPEAEGKVFLYKYGKKIFDKLNDAMNPPFEGVEPLNPFDFWEGADFHLKIRTTTEGAKKWPNYDQSSFGPPRPLFDKDEKLKEVYAKEYSLQEFLNPANYKSYDELKRQLDAVLGDGGPTARMISRAEDEELPWATKVVAPTFKEKAAPAVDHTVADEDDEDMKYFSKLAKGE